MKSGRPGAFASGLKSALDGLFTFNDASVFSFCMTLGSKLAEFMDFAFLKMHRWRTSGASVRESE